MLNESLNTLKSLVFLSVSGWALVPTDAAADSHVLIFRADATTGGRAHKKLLKSGLRFRRLQKTKMVLIEETDKVSAADFKADADFSFIEEDRKWRPTDYVSLNQTPDSDEWVPDFYENTKAAPTSVPTPTQNVILGIVDSGIRINHPYFAGILAKDDAEANGKPGVDDDGDGFVDNVYGANTYSTSASVEAGDPEHGTHVASLATLSIRQSKQPTASSIRILPVNFMASGDSGTTSSALMALEYEAQRGAKVINVSWGGEGLDNYSQALYEAFEDLYNDDILVVAAAGNATNNNDNNPFFPSSFNLPNLISVASVTPQYGYQDTGLLGIGLSFFSNFGVLSVDVGAPGELSYAGSSVGILGANGGADYASNPYIRMMGTSMAAPVVSGVAAVIRSLNKKLSASETKQIILDTANVDSGDLMGLSLASGIVSPSAAYAKAIATTGTSQNPEIPSNPVRGNIDASDLNTQRAGGCGQVINVAGGGPPEGPLGGNSILLLSGAYLLIHALRQRKSLLRNSANCV